MYHLSIVLLCIVTMTWTAPTPGYTITYTYPGATSCQDKAASITVIPTSCNTLNGNPYGYVVYNDTKAVYFSCSDAACTSCTQQSVTSLGTCQGSKKVLASTTVPDFPVGSAVETDYSKPGCNQADLLTIFVTDGQCRQAANSNSISNSRPCNATTVVLFNDCLNVMCIPSSCTSMGTYSTNTCFNFTSSTSRKFSCVTGTACQFAWQCAGYGNPYGASECKNGQCVCRQSFSGSAQANNKCTCGGANRVVYDQGGNPNCVAPGVCSVGGQNMRNLCSDYTTNWNFIDCVNGKCTCLNGFAGNATIAYKCQCKKTLTWTQNGPHCQ